MEAYTLFGKLEVDTSGFSNKLYEAERLLENAEHAIAKTEQQAINLGKSTATTARGFEKLNEKTSQTYKSLSDAIQAFNKGEINAKQLDRAITGASKAFGTLESKAKDAGAKLADGTAKSGSFATKLGLVTTAGNLAANAISKIASEAKDFIVEGVKMNASLDKLVRFTSTLDKSFQSPAGLKKFKDDINDLTKIIPHDADKIAEASFSIKSAFSDLTEPQTIEFLKQFGMALIHPKPRQP